MPYMNRLWPSSPLNTFYLVLLSYTISHLQNGQDGVWRSSYAKKKKLCRSLANIHNNEREEERRKKRKIIKSYNRKHIFNGYERWPSNH